MKKLGILLTFLMFQSFPILWAEGPTDNYTGVNETNYLSFRTGEELKRYFRYNENGTILISGHRGGHVKGFPENSMEGFRHVLDQMPAFFEIDPRLTKDSVIVLMHDDTLDRTTTATGKLSDYTWSELQDVRLKDIEGNVTEFKIPTLEEVIIWSRGKTVINLDKKDVPMEMITELIRKHNAEKHVMLTVHTGAQARFYYDRFPDIMMSAFSRTDKEYEDLAICGVPWENMIAYIGSSINEKNKHLVEKLHAHGVRCMISVAPTHDKLPTAGERKVAYRKSIQTKPDIIESDLPVEVWQAMQEN